MPVDQYKPVGSSVSSDVSFTRRKEVLVTMPLTDYTLRYHYGDLDQTPVRGVSYLATLVNGETRQGTLDDKGRAVLQRVKAGPVSVVYQHDEPDTDDAEIAAAREEVRRALDAIVQQTRQDMAAEWKEWNEAGWLKRHYLLKVNQWQGTAVGAWEWLSGTVQTVWQLAVLLYKTDREIRELRNLIITGQWGQLDRKIAGYRAKGEKVLEAASETKELLILIFHDEKTREIIQAFPAQWWAAIPPDEREELQASFGTQIAIDVIIAVLLAAFSAGAGGAMYGSAKWSQRIGKLGSNVVRLLDKLQEAFKKLVTLLRRRKRRRVDVRRRANARREIETVWEAERAREAAAKARALARERKDGGHSIARHGPEVSDADLKKRLETGQAPDGKFSPTKASTRFSSYEEWEKTRADALANISKEHGVDLTKPPGPNEPTEHSITMDHGRPIDEGFVGDPASKSKFTDPLTGKKGPVYSKSNPVDGITRTQTAIEWNSQANEWQVVQHYPDAQGWDQASKSYKP